MRRIQLNAFACARVWDGELPDALYSGESLSRHLGPSSTVAPMHLAALEVYVPRGPMAEYALLGGKFRPDDSGCLRLALLTTETSNKSFESLAAGVDEVKVGLPGEYAAAVMEGLAAKDSIPSGVLEISHAAHGLVGSNAIVFKRVASLLFELLCGPQPTDEEMRDLVLGF